jgi:hypothetical protein
MSWAGSAYAKKRKCKVFLDEGKKRVRIKKKKSEKKLKKDFTKEKYDDILYEHSARVT